MANCFGILLAADVGDEGRLRGEGLRGQAIRPAIFLERCEERGRLKHHIARLCPAPVIGRIAANARIRINPPNNIPKP